MLLCWKGLLPITIIAFLGAGIAVFQTSLPLQLFWRFLILVLLVLFAVTVRQGLAPVPRRAAPPQGGSR